MIQMAIIVKEIKNDPVRFFNPDGTLLCETNNELVFNDIRIQIKDQQLSGYYIVFKCKKHLIDIDGQFEIWPGGLFDISTKQLNYLLGLTNHLED